MEELIIKAKKGDKAAFTELFVKFENDLYKLAKVKIKSEEDVEDVVQETMIKAFISIRKLKSNKAFKKWIVQILFNNCKRYFKKKERRECSFEIEIVKLDKTDQKDFFESTENDVDFKLLLHSLSEEEKIIILLFYNERYTTKEIGSLLGLNENTVKSKLARAKKKIKILKESEEKIWMK